MKNEINFKDLEMLLGGGIFYDMALLDENAIFTIYRKDYSDIEEAFSVSDNDIVPSSPTSI